MLWVVPDGAAAAAAAAAGVQRKDILTAANGTSVVGMGELRDVMEAVAPGDTVELSLLREDQSLSVSVTAAERPARRFSLGDGTVDSERAWLGLGLATLSDRVADRLDITPQDGVVVLRVSPEGPAASADVQQNDVITAINGEPVTSVHEVRAALKEMAPDDPVQLSIARGDQTLDVTVTAGTAPARSGGGLKGRWHSGGLSGAFPLPELQDIPREERLEHLLAGQFTVIDKDGNEVTIHVTYGTVTSASSSSLTIVPNGQDQPITYQITEDTNLRTGSEELKADDKVVVVTKDDATEASAVMAVHSLGAKHRGLRSFRKLMPGLMDSRLRDVGLMDFRGWDLHGKDFRLGDVLGDAMDGASFRSGRATPGGGGEGYGDGI